MSTPYALRFTNYASRISHHVSLRRELRLALLAAMECCWVYAALAFVSDLIGAPRPVSPLSLFAAYWMALFVGRVLPRLRARWLLLQCATIAVAALTVLAVIRIEIIGSRFAPLDFGWLAQYIGALLALSEGISGEFVATFAVLYVFIRGLGFAQRPLTLWFIGFQFRLGIVAFFILLLGAGWQRTPIPAAWIFIYFFLSLLAIALARVDEVGSPITLGPRWASTLLAAVALALFLGLGVMQLFTLETADAIFAFLAPVFAILAVLMLLVITPVAMVLGWLLGFLEPFFQRFWSAFAGLGNMLPQGWMEQFQKAGPPNGLLDALGPLLKWLFIVTVVLGVAILLARALNRRMNLIEEELYAREAIDGEDDSARVRESTRAKKPAARRRSNALSAETIRRIYAALVARAADMGLPRRTAETPYEFLPRLTDALPDAADNVHAITEAYVAVHYGEHEATNEEVSRVREAWRQVDQVFKQRRYKA